MSRFLTLLCILAAFEISAQPVFFETAFGTEHAEVARALVEYPDGMIFVAGIRENGPLGGYDFALSKLSAAGSVVWTKFLGTPGDDNCLSMTRAADGNLVLAGETTDIVNGLDGYLVKADTSGNVLWTKQIGTPLNESFRFIDTVSDGGFVCAGFQNDANGTNDSWFVRLDPQGEVIWSEAYGGHDADYADNIREIPGKGFIASGDTKSNGAGGYDNQLFRMDDAGILKWDNTFGDELQNGCQGMTILTDGSFLTYGETEIAPSSAYEMFLEKIDTSGESIWKRTFGGAGTDAIFSLIENPDGSFMFTGYTTSVGGGPLNVAVGKANASGHLEFLRAYGSNGIDIGHEIKRSLSGGYLIAGRTARPDDQFYVLHLNDDGLLNVMEKSRPPVIVFPNPSDGLLRFIGIESITELKVYDATGRIVYEGLLSPHTELLSLDLCEGVYFLNLNSGLSSGTHKLILKNAD